MPCDVTLNRKLVNQCFGDDAPFHARLLGAVGLVHRAGCTLKDTLSTEAPQNRWRRAPWCPSRRSWNDDTRGQHHSLQLLHSYASAILLDRNAIRGAYEGEGV